MKMFKSGIQSEQGFVLATSLVMLMLLTVLSIGVYFGTVASQKTSAAAESATEAFYYAETGINYIGWSLKNDAEFDSYTYPQFVDTAATGGTDRHSFGEPDVRTSLLPFAVGDTVEWGINQGHPSGEDAVVGTFDGANYYGQVMYFDNSPLSGRALSWPHASAYAPTLDGIHTKLPRYIRLDIDDNGNVTPALPPYSVAAPHHGSVVGVDIPKNGAIVWITGGYQDADYEIVPFDRQFTPFVDMYSNATVSNTIEIDAAGTRALWTKDAAGNYLVGTDLQYQGGLLFPNPLGTFYTNYPCDIYAFTEVDIACGRTEDLTVALTNPLTYDAYTWLTTANYGMVAYAIGYTDGKPRKILRVVLNLN